MSNGRDAGSSETRASSRADLGQYYRKIGISAIAAALPYVGAQKNHAYAPATPKVVTIRDLELLRGGGTRAKAPSKLSLLHRQKDGAAPPDIVDGSMSAR